MLCYIYITHIMIGGGDDHPPVHVVSMHIMIRHICICYVRESCANTAFVIPAITGLICFDYTVQKEYNIQHEKGDYRDWHVSIHLLMFTI